MNNGQEYPFHEEESIDIRKYLFKILRNWYWFLLSILICITTAYLINRYSKPVYSVSTKIILGTKDNSSNVQSAENIIRGVDFTRQNIIENEIDILKSYSLNYKVIQGLDIGISYVQLGRRGIVESNIYKKCPFTVLPVESRQNLKNYPVYITILSEHMARIEIDDCFDIKAECSFGEPFKSDQFNFEVVKNENFNNDVIGNKYYFVINNINALANQYRQKLEVRLNDPKGSILTLSSKGNNSQQEADYLNKLTEIYIEYGLNEKNKTAINTINFIDDQLATVNDSLFSAEDRLQNFRLANRIVDLSQKGTVYFDQLTSLQSEHVHTLIKKNYFQYLKKFINESKAYNEIVAPAITEVDDPVLTSLINELKNIYTEKFNISINLKESYRILNDYDARILSLKNALLKNIDNSIASIQLTLSGIEEHMAHLEKNIRKLPVEERKMIGIERDFNVNNNIYNYLLEKRAEAAIAKASNVSDDKVLDMALVENSVRIKPDAHKNYLLGIVLGLIIPVIIIVIFEFFKNTIDDIKALTLELDIPIIGKIKHCNYNSSVPVYDYPKTTLAETFRTLRTNMQYLSTNGKSNTIAITSANSGEGKTFCALNLSASIAMNGKKVLLAGMDMRKPDLYTNLNINNETGLSTFLIGKHNVYEIIQPTGIKNFSIVSSGPVPPNPVELLSNGRLKEFFDFAGKEFDYIIVDTPPASIVSDVLIINNYCDHVFFMVRMNYTRKFIIELIKELREKKALKNINLVVNDLKALNYYGYGKYHGYYDYYSNGNGNNSNGHTIGMLKYLKKNTFKKIFDFSRQEN